MPLWQKNLPFSNPNPLWILSFWAGIFQRRIFRPEECEWAIRFDVCLRCMKKRERYAQRILFMKEGGPYREHGCYTDEKGFYLLK